MTALTQAELEKRFRYRPHSLRDIQGQIYLLAQAISDGGVPDCREQRAALDALEVCKMWVEKAVSYE